MPDEVYFVIALTRLEKANGWHHFFESPNVPGTPYMARKEEAIDLEVGDAIIWKGDCEGRRRDGQGGIMLIVTYR